MYPNYFHEEISSARLSSRPFCILESRKSYSTNFGVLYLNMKPVIFALRVLGVLPISTTNSKMEFKLRSKSMAYSVLVYMCMMALWISQAMKIFAQEKRFDHVVNKLSTMIYFTILIGVPVIMWTGVHTLIVYFNSWKQFEERFSQLLQQHLELHLQRRSLVSALVAMVTAFALETTYMGMSRCFVWSRWITNMYQTILRYLLGIFFYLLCCSIVRTADSILNLFRLDVKHGSSKTGKLVAKYKIVWLELSRLVNLTGTACNYTFGFYILYLFLNLILCLYLTATYTGSKKKIVVNVETTISTSLLLYFMCNAGQSVKRQVVEVFQDELLKMRSGTCHVMSRREVDSFLNMIKIMKVSVNVGGFIIIRRSLLVSLGSSLVTYLIVLVQFQFQVAGNV